jgi:catechol 2,3-dioxygenase-like lactoylglutathione lyase family enzyme
MTVCDMDRAVEFYSALTFQKVSDVEVLGDEFEHLEGVFGARMRIVRMELGNEYLDLTQYLAPPGRPIPADSRSKDLWFQHAAIVLRDMDQAFEKLRALKVQFVSTGPQTLPPSIKAAAGIKAFYFRDPDQHDLEIIYFPPGKGDLRWQEKTDKLFLGIDHTAIGISNTDASLKFYRNLLGLSKARESENFGTEQEHLKQVSAAHLRITGMRAASGPGIAFLEDLTPRDGRPPPADVHAKRHCLLANDDCYERPRSSGEEITRRTRSFCLIRRRDNAKESGRIFKRCADERSRWPQRIAHSEVGERTRLRAGWHDRSLLP